MPKAGQTRGMQDSPAPALPPASARKSGVLLHPTSLPGPRGIGELGAAARLFVDWLVQAGQSIWQILPLVPPGPGGSPYSTPSAFAGNPWLIDLAGLVQDGLLSERNAGEVGGHPDHVDFAQLKAQKDPVLAQATAALLSRPKEHGLRAELDAFCAANSWVEDHALYTALREANAGQPWWLWEPALRDRDAGALADAKAALGAQIAHHAALQFLFERQWRSLRAYANAAGVQLLGDVPIYVDRDSVECWVYRDQFLLNDEGAPSVIAGVPPDPFSEVGQLWGNPLYDWEAMRADGHRFWVARMRHALARTDLVRIDHFRGLSAYWEVPADAEDARAGRWRPGPGMALFEDLRAALGELPIVVEDLGVIDEPVRQLRDTLGFPGMNILQFAFGDDENNPYLPYLHAHNSVVYTGTHDTDTVVGWWRGTSERVRDHVRRYLRTSGQDIAWDLIHCAMTSVAQTAIIPMQDLLSLGADARMNVPGLAEGNWSWRVRVDALNDEVAARLLAHTQIGGRAPQR